MGPQVDIDALLKTANLAALEAGKRILEIYSGTFSVQRKQDNSPVTIADLEANKLILEQLSSTGIPVISEEEKEDPYPTREKWDYCWLVDPLDGTKEFVNRNGEFTVNIALVKYGKPIFGVIYAPVTDILYAGGEKIQTYKRLRASTDQAEIIKILPTKSGVPYRIAVSRSHGNPETQLYIQKKKQEHQDIELVISGSSLKFCKVAEGLADEYPRFGPTMEWDTAAGHAIIMGIGKQVYEVKSGKVLTYNKPNLTNPDFIVK